MINQPVLTVGVSGQRQSSVQALQRFSQSWTRLGFCWFGICLLWGLLIMVNYGVLYDIGSWTDVPPEFGNDSHEASDNFMTGRANGVLTYRNNDFLVWLMVRILRCSIRAK